MSKIKVIGITGGIASGKSTVTSYLRELGYFVLDADELVHNLQAIGQPLYNAIYEHFGEVYFKEDKSLDRKKLAKLVFSDENARAELSEIQDHIIRAEIEKICQQKLATSDASFFMDIPLLLEENYQPLFDEVWLVSLAEEIQIKRLMSRNGYTQEEAEARIKSQMPLAEKAKMVEVILDNSKDIAYLKAEVEAELERINKD